MTFCILGKSGDILSAAPIMLHCYQQQKEPVKVVTSKDYLTLFDRMPFALAESFPGNWTDLDGALRWAKQRHQNVVCLGTYGKDFPIEWRTSSFQLEQYDRAGVLSKWDTLPLTGFKRGTPVKFKQPSILFADASMSSPFMQKEDLYKLLKESFPKHHIARLSMLKAGHLVDCLDWYDAADALVTIETAHLHLSAGTKTPVAALATDRPSKWHGSAWSKRFAFYCRYSEYDDRKQELVRSLREAMEKKPQLETVQLN